MADPVTEKSFESLAELFACLIADEGRVLAAEGWALMGLTSFEPADFRVLNCD